jgi:hypothetical protein
MKKALFMLIVSCTLFFSLSAYGGSLNVTPPALSGVQGSDELEELGTFELTGGIDKEHESTFDKSRTIAGTGEKDTAVVIAVYLSADSEPVTVYELTIGASGMFSQRVDLELGNNVIVITACKDGLTKETKLSINRKKLEIKLELEQPGILLPGQKPAQ